MELNKIYNMDALEYMGSLPDKCVDLVLCDPPYGIGESCGKNKSRGKLTAVRDYHYGDWDIKRIDVKYINEMLRVSVNQVIYGGNFYADLLPASNCWLVWDKHNGKSDFADCELAWTSFSSATRKIDYLWHGMLQSDMKNKQQRSTQMPVYTGIL